MSATVLAFRPKYRRPAAPPLPAPRGGDVYLIPAEGGWLVCDTSPSGGSAGTHGWHADRADAVTEAQQLAQAIDGMFCDDEPRGAA